MKAVLISIQPKWCELIASGKKTVEVRKTRPKNATPFKVYIYETMGLYKGSGGCLFNGRGKVIGEFVCYKIEAFAANAHTAHLVRTEQIAHSACIPMDKLVEYGYKSTHLYAWHISDLVIYDTPKKLGEFYHACKQPSGTDCSKCLDEGKTTYWSFTRPPQSWAYCEELK